VEPDDLYALPLEEFTVARNALAKEHPELKQLRKPSVAAYAINQLARRHASELDAFLDAAARLRRAQLGRGDPATETAAERAALRRLLQLAGEYAPATQQPRIQQTLEAAAVDDGAAEQVRAGRLERELEPAGFGSLVAATVQRRSPQRDTRAERRAKLVAKAEAAKQEAQQALEDAETAEREAREEWERLRAAAGEARRRVEEAERALREARRT
jgi:hypothetical protein